MRGEVASSIEPSRSSKDVLAFYGTAAAINGVDEAGPITEIIILLKPKMIFLKAYK